MSDPLDDMLDRDLRRALAPLDREPADVAAEVIARLPSADPAPGTRARRTPREVPPRLRVPWWGAAATLALGFGLGWWAATAGADAHRDPDRTSLPDVASTGQGPGGGDAVARPAGGTGTGTPDERDDPTDPKPVPGQPIPMEERVGLEVRALGPITVVEPDHDPQVLGPNRYIVPQGTRIETEDSRAGGFAFPEDLLFRLDRNTVATIGPKRDLSVATGRLWLGASGPELHRVATPYGVLSVGKGALMITVSDVRADVLVLGGDVAAAPEDGPERTVAAGQWFALDEAAVTDLRAAGFTGADTAWMTDFVVLQMDPTERIARAEQMVEALADDRYRDAARLEILRLGSYAVPSLMRTARDDRRRDVRIAAVNLVRRVADFSSAEGLIPWLMVEDEEIRERVFDALVRVTGTDVGTSLRFWREAPESERRRAMNEWLRFVSGR